MDGEVSVRRLAGVDAVARRLLAATEAEGSRTYGPFTGERTSVVAPEELVPPRGCYVALSVGGSAVAGGCVRRLDDGVGEVKRMWVAPELRGRGLARRLLAELEAAAADLGFARVRLDTGGSLSSFYVAEGYEPIADYNGNTYATFWGEKRL